MIKTGKIVLLDSATSSFVRDDINILSKNDRIKIIDTGVFVKKLGETLKILLKSVIESICATVILTWFADYYSVLPALISGLSGKYFIVTTWPEIAGSEGYEIALDGWNHLDLDEVS
ncbi:hypothetical protein KJ656_00200 [bacterium]|nr:hypothetical protein [bacterium]